MAHSSFIIRIISEYRYVGLFALACFEGPLVALAAGFLIRLGYLSLLPVFGILLLGDLVPDAIYYGIGRFGTKEKIQKRFERYSAVSKHLNFLERMWHEHTFKTTFASKMVWGLSTPLLATAGLSRTPFWKFMSYALLIVAARSAVTVGLGYYLGQSYASGNNYIASFSIALSVVIVILAALVVMIKKYSQAEIVKIEAENERI